MISILYIDEWQQLLDIICRFLERGGDMIVEKSLSIDEALRKMDEFSFDVIVTDYNSKESPGIDLLRQTRQKGIMTPFVFFTLEQNRGLEYEAAQYSQIAFVPKLPCSGSKFGFDELQKTIRTIIPASHSENIHLQKDPIYPMHGEDLL